MTKRRPQKPRHVLPDETFQRGPFQMARFGRHLVWQTKWQKDEFAEMQARAVAQLPKVIAEIDELVASIADLVRQLEPTRLLLRAWWDMASRHINVEAESDIGKDEALSVRMLDYVQSIIASVQPAVEQHDASDEEWSALQKLVESLFTKVNLELQICETATRKSKPGFSDEFEEFRFKALLYWINVRGRRYQVHDPIYLKEVFPQHNDILQKLFGVSGDVFVEGLTSIWHNLSFGLQDSFADVESFRKDTLDAMDRKIATLDPSDKRTFQELMAEVVDENGWRERGEQAFSGMFGLDHFDLERTTKFPPKLLDELSWAPGDDKEFFEGDAAKGWPLRIWPVAKRPFLKINGKYYCFDLYSFLDNIYRVMQRTIIRLAPEYAETWKHEQTKLSEGLPLHYFGRLLPGATITKAVYYRGDVGNGKIDWCEADALIAYEDHLLIVECRGGAFTYASPATDFEAYVESLRNLVLKPANQCSRFRKYLEAHDAVPIFDKDHNQIGELRHADYRHIAVCPVTLDAFTEIAAQVQHLKKIGLDVGDKPVWAISLDDLRVYADVFTNPLVFLHYIEKRMEAFQTDAIESNDEFDHLGLYFKHNNYRQLAEEMKGKVYDKVTFDGYRTDIDKFFRERMFDASYPCPLKQEAHRRLWEIVDAIEASAQIGRAKVVSYLLNLSGDTRDAISKFIDEELAQQPQTLRPKPLSVHGSVEVTIYCWSPHTRARDSEAALAHAQSVILATGEKSRLLLELEFDDQSSLKEVWWAWVDRSEIPKVDIPRLEVEAEKLRKRRIVASVSEHGKVGRNDQCPCGSGRKFKKCCIGR